jgi:hypothetical protein
VSGAARPSDFDLWVSTAEAVLARGRGLFEAVHTADRVIAAFWKNGGMPRGGPGLAKCPPLRAGGRSGAVSGPAARTSL